MRTWSTPEWVKNQDKGSFQRGWANVRNYGQGPTWLRVKWSHMYKVENQEQQDGMVRIRDEQTKREYIVDVNELNHWTRYA
jgi:hypothetical protein